MWSSFLPLAGFFIRRRWRRRTDGLTLLRGTQASLVLSLSFFLAALSFVEPWGRVRDRRVLAIVGVLGFASLAMVALMRRRPLPANPASSLAASYRAVFFIEIGYAESAALFGFAGALIAGSCWVYVLGLVFSLIGHAMTAPTRRDIERRQREIAATGSPLSLLDALMAPPARPGSATSE
jgi:predicted cobalt transporter CbtA